jgi:hypothetical protein
VKEEAMLKPRKSLLVAASITLLLLAASQVTAATKYVQSPTRAAVFFRCEQGFFLCAPYGYTWRASVNLTYTSNYDQRLRKNVVTISKVDQTVLMFQAGRFGNPCKVQLASTVDVYENGSRRIATIRPTHGGSYIYSPNDLLVGGVSYPNLRVVNPTFQINARAASIECWNWGPSFSWQFGL